MSEPRLEPPSPSDPSPLWREELPIHATDERYVDRRQLAKFLVLTSLGMLVGNLWILAKGWWAGKPAYPERPVARAAGRLECPCHEGYFTAADGRVLQGPPQRPLPRILLARRGELLVATGVELGAGGSA